MRFAWGRAEATENGSVDLASFDAPSDETTPFELASVELLTVDGIRVGWIATQGQRTSDWLNSRSEVPVYGLAEPSEAGAPSPPSATGTPPQDLARESIIWAVPPPLPANRHLRLHRRRMLVHLELDAWDVSGQVHVRPGADAIDQVMRGTRDMIPLTEVQVAPRDEPGRGASLPVVIVNRSHVRRVVVDQPHVSQPVPDPVGEPNPVALRLAALGASSEAVAAVEAQEPAPAGEPSAAPAPAQAAARGEPAAVTTAADDPIESGTELVQAALTVLLEVGVIDVVEFQSIRARVPADHPAG